MLNNVINVIKDLPLQKISPVNAKKLILFTKYKKIKIQSVFQIQKNYQDVYPIHLIFPVHHVNPTTPQTPPLPPNVPSLPAPQKKPLNTT